MSELYLEQKKNTHLCFQIGGNSYAVNTGNVLEIMKLPLLDYPQKLPNNIVGLLKYNNFVINVIDIRFYLNIDVTPYNSNNELLILKTDEVIFGVITDKIVGILPFEQELINQIPYKDNKMIIDSLYKYEDETFSIVNVYSLEMLLKQHDISLPETDIISLFPTDESSKQVMRQRSLSLQEKASMRFVPEGLHVENKYISFNLNRDFYCIALDFVKEVLKDTTITKVPGTPDYIEGIMNLRGDYITVINLKRFLDLPEEVINERRPVIIVKTDELQIALSIDKINELFDYQEDENIEMSDSYFAKEFIYLGNLYTILNVNKIISDKRLVVTDM